MDELDEIMEYANQKSNLTKVPFTLPNVRPGDLVLGKVKFIVKMVGEGGMYVQLLDFTPGEPPPQAPMGGGQIVPSPS